MASALIRYSGYVQGVGFRFTARSIARRYAVSGYVRNLSDGRVEVAAEGAEAEIRAFMEDLASQMEPNIDDVQVSWAEDTGEFNGFAVRF